MKKQGWAKYSKYSYLSTILGIPTFVLGGSVLVPIFVFVLEKVPYLLSSESCLYNGIGTRTSTRESRYSPSSMKKCQTLTEAKDTLSTINKLKRSLNLKQIIFKHYSFFNIFGRLCHKNFEKR